MTAGYREMIDGKLPRVGEDIRQKAGDEKCRHVVVGKRVKELVGVPLLEGEGRALGVLGLLDKKGQAKISDNDVQRAAAMAQELAVALEGAQNMALSDQHRKRAETLMEMALELGSALRLPEFVNSFTVRVCTMMQAQCAILALAHGSKIESVGFHGVKPQRNLQRRLNAPLSEDAGKYPDPKVTGSGLQLIAKDVIDAFGWKNLTLVRLEGTESALRGTLCFGDLSR